MQHKQQATVRGDLVRSSQNSPWLQHIYTSDLSCLYRHLKRAEQVKSNPAFSEPTDLTQQAPTQQQQSGVTPNDVMQSHMSDLIVLIGL